MQERGYAVDHTTVQRWVVHYAPRIERAFRNNKKRAGDRWRLDETYVKIKGEWKYLYRAVDKQGNIIDLMQVERVDILLQIEASSPSLFERLSTGLRLRKRSPID